MAELEQPSRIGEAEGRYVGLALVQGVDRPEPGLDAAHGVDALQRRHRGSDADRCDEQEQAEPKEAHVRPSSVGSRRSRQGSATISVTIKRSLSATKRV